MCKTFARGYAGQIRLGHKELAEKMRLVAVRRGWWHDDLIEEELANTVARTEISRVATPVVAAKQAPLYGVALLRQQLGTKICSIKFDAAPISSGEPTDAAMKEIAPAPAPVAAQKEEVLAGMEGFLEDWNDLVQNGAISGRRAAYSTAAQKAEKYGLNCVRTSAGVIVSNGDDQFWTLTRGNKFKRMKSSNLASNEKPKMRKSKPTSQKESTLIASTRRSRRRANRARATTPSAPQETANPGGFDWGVGSVKAKEDVKVTFNE